ncbi:MAG: dienelactone hydrolase family protein [Methylococcaceae bacterium]
MAIISNNVTYLDGDVACEGFFAFDDSFSGRRPAVLVSHPWAGRNEFVLEKAKQLAELGYVGFALDMYGSGKVGASHDENAQLMQPFIDDRAMLQKRIQAALSAVKLLPWVDDKAIAAIGFCFGGLCVLDLARTGVDIKGVVSFHGLLNAPDNLQGIDIKAKVLALHGHDDPMGKVEQVLAFEEEMTKAHADWQLHAYGNTVHAFTNPAASFPELGMVYSEMANRRSWLAMRNFLDELFE